MAKINRHVKEAKDICDKYINVKGVIVFRIFTDGKIQSACYGRSNREQAETEHKMNEMLLVSDELNSVGVGAEEEGLFMMGFEDEEL